MYYAACHASGLYRGAPPPEPPTQRFAASPAPTQQGLGSAPSSQVRYRSSDAPPPAPYSEVRRKSSPHSARARPRPLLAGSL